MALVRDLIRNRHSAVKGKGVDFTFTFTFTPEAMFEIENMGDEFNNLYNYTVSFIPGTKTKLICISLKERR
jgi:hypothetical protein